MKALIALALLAPLLVLAQDETPQPPLAAPKPCSSEQHRQFDFWVGTWEVTQNGQPTGRNHIELVHGDCALAEHWVSAGGNFSGASLNIYDQANDKWHQTWVDTGGTLLELNGGLEDGSMVLSGARPGPDGAEVINRISWTPNTDGSVRQLWESSPDGETWTVAFDGLYIRAGQAE